MGATYLAGMHKNAWTTAAGIAGSIISSQFGTSSNKPMPKKGKHPSKHESRKNRKVKRSTRYDRSHTATRTKKKSKESTEEIRGSINRYHIQIDLKHKRIHKPLGHIRTTQTHSSTLVCTAGVQLVTTLFSVQSIAQCITSSGTSYTTEQNNLAYFDLNPYETTTNTSNSNLMLTQKPKDDRIVFKSVQLDLTFTNLSNVQTIVDIYILSAKSPTSLNPFVAWNQGYLDTALNEPTATYRQLPATAAVSGYPDNQYYDVKPKQSPTFNRFWKIEYTKCLSMAVDQTDKVIFDIALNRMLKKEYIQGLVANSLAGVANNNLYMPGTLFCMSVVRSAVVEPESSAGNRCTFSSAKVGYVGIVRSHLHTVPDNAGRLNFNNVAYAIAQNPTLTNIKLDPVDNAEAFKSVG